MRGFHETSMRDIARRSGMLPGSIYCHFASKEELLAEVYAEGVARITAAVTAADPGPEAAPRARLEAMLTAHLTAILDRSAYARVVLRVQPDAAPGVAPRLVALRDGYEAVIGAAVERVAGPGAGLARLLALGAANHVPVWYRKGRAGPGEIARTLTAMVAP